MESSQTQPSEQTALLRSSEGLISEQTALLYSSEGLLGISVCEILPFSLPSPSWLSLHLFKFPFSINQHTAFMLAFSMVFSKPPSLLLVQMFTGILVYQRVKKKSTANSFREFSSIFHAQCQTFFMNSAIRRERKTLLFLSYLFVWVVLGIKARASCIQGRCSVRVHLEMGP